MTDAVTQIAAGAFSDETSHVSVIWQATVSAVFSYNNTGLDKGLDIIMWLKYAIILLRLTTCCIPVKWNIFTNGMYLSRHRNLFL